MKKIIPLLFGASMILTLSACGVGGKTKGHTYNFKYPTADHAIWWEMHENRIKQEPSIRDVEGMYSITCNLDLEDIGFLGINDYFNLIMADGYTISTATSNITDPNDWLKKDNPIPHTTFELHTDPFETSFTTSYHNNYRIELSGTNANATVPYQLAIYYTNLRM